MSTLPGRNHMSISTPSLDGKGSLGGKGSLDGKGGTESAAEAGNSTKRTGPSYGAFESNHPLYNNDRFIGRIPSKSFAPPLTVASIKRSLCKLEDLSKPDKALLFTPLSSPAPKEDSARLSLYGPSGPGLSEQDPIALVVESEKRTEEVSQLDKLPERFEETEIHYGKSFYYRVYLSEGKGDEKAKTSFDESDLSLGRINTLFIAPPHTAGSLKACIAKLESLVTSGHALYNDMELFENVNSDAGMSDTDIISFQGDTYPGSDEGDPVSLVNATTNTAADQKTKPIRGKVLGKYLLAIAATNRAFSDGPDSKFTKRARLTGTGNYHSGNSAWLFIIRDEIVYTDGVSISKKYSPNSRISFPFCFITRYMVINSKGEKGFVMSRYVQFI
ncbi:uncharacterized protein LACBIDRAFT_330868 [Laccaria bicolor S238N-H82]|uniref:Predicted protein n=1 Tax=Laccaria bicolor (strain S238N-H82 / ATCC MYA-4686) TaxID=486041 RepID=B0DN07_LACBS|nr:uncharacterized protein LACBIDRAFT_330868 [Laccaria bicolor S238N-H82]EDR03969.1 predicted protein [Laccaria bicolor S238N-H82]|eukprot:XP_001885224.1 predicted protein [Laccaria bicolor S238N-H82]